MAFSTDGSLFVSIGDGASYNNVDPRATRVQDIDSLSGKVLRIDPLSGQGLSSNPYFNGDVKKAIAPKYTKADCAIRSESVSINKLAGSL